MTVGSCDAGLGGAIVALSLSPPQDGGRLGYLDREFHGLAFDLAQQILRRRGRVLYGGHLHAGGITLEIFEHIAEAYASGEALRDPAGPKPVVNLLAGSELGKTTFERLAEVLQRYQGFVEVRIVVEETGEWLRLHRSDTEGALLHVTKAGSLVTTLVGQDSLDQFAAARVQMTDAGALTAMRRAAAAVENARIVAGGRRGDLGVQAPEGETGLPDRYGGAMPGIFEEIIVSLPRVPVAILGAWGGAAREAAFELGLLDPDEVRVPYLGEEQTGVAEGRRQLVETWAALPESRRREQARLSPFVSRDDVGTLARDITAELARLLQART